MPRVAGLLAGLILMAQLVAPWVGRGPLRVLAPIDPGCTDPVDPDGDEAPTPGGDSLLFARGRNAQPSPSRNERRPGFLPLRAVLLHFASCREDRADVGDEAGHFLAEGRSFRHWIQSLTC